MQDFDYRQQLAPHYPTLATAKRLSTTVYHNSKPINITAQRLGYTYHIGIEFFEGDKFIGFRTFDLKELSRLYQQQE